jgi:isopenicillin-N epimerase
MHKTNTPTPGSSPVLEQTHVADYFLLRKDVAFFNHGSFGACPRPVFETYQRWQRELESQPVDFLGRRLHELLPEARSRLAEYVGTTAENLVFVPNVTHGVNAVTRSLNLQPGDEVLATSHEYGATQQAWRYTCQKRGAHYIVQPIALPVDNAQTVVDQLWAGVTERTRLILVSHITSSTALILPIEEICRRARAAGILTLVDGAHAPGQVDLALDTLAADFYAGNCHKWLCSPKGAGFLYVRPELQPTIEPLIVGWAWGNEQPDSTPFIDYFQWSGTDDPAAYLSVPAAIAFQREHDWPQVRAACHQLAGQARAQIQALTGLPHICPDSERWWMQMFTVPLPPCDPLQVKQRLWEEHLVEVPIFEREDQVFIRVSVQAYNRPSDVDRLLEGLRQILPNS